MKIININPHISLTVAAAMSACVQPIQLGEAGQSCPCATGFECALPTQKCVAQVKQDAGSGLAQDSLGEPDGGGAFLADADFSPGHGPEVGVPDHSCAFQHDAGTAPRQRPDAGPPTCNQVSATAFGPAVVGAPLDLLYTQPAEDALPEATACFGGKESRRSAAAVLASDESNLYLCHGPVIRLGKSDQSVSTIAQGAGCGFSIAMTDGRVVFVGDAQAIGGRRVGVVSATGGDQKTIAAGSAIMSVATDGQAVWWADHDLDPQQSFPLTTGFSIWTADMAGAGRRSLFRGISDYGSFDVYRIVPTPSQFFVSGYWWGDLSKTPAVFDLASTFQQILLFSSAGSKLDMADDGTELWVIDDGVVRSTMKGQAAYGGTTHGRVADSALSSQGREALLTRGLVANGEGVWVASNDEETSDYSIRSLPKAAATYNLLAACNRPISDLVVDAQGIYAVTITPTMVWKLSR